MIVVIDNYDSFTYNLVQYLGELGAVVRVMRNDAVTVDDVRAAKPDRIVISPGPGRPEAAGITMAAIGQLGQTIPILGCASATRRLGRYSAGRWCGRPCRCTARRRRSSTTGTVCSRGLTVLSWRRGITRWSWPTIRLPADLIVSARTREDQTIMGLRHRTWPVHGVQFHPESILTAEGKRILRNFVEDRWT